MKGNSWGAVSFVHRAGMGSRVGNAGKSEAVLLITPGAYPQVSSIKWPSEPSQGCFCSGIVAVVQSLSRVQLSVTPWTTARQASLSFTISWSLLRLMSIELVMPSNHLIHCHPLLLLPPIFPTSGSFPMSQVAKVLDLQLQH